MSRELCNCSNLMTHPCTTPAPKHGLQNCTWCKPSCWMETRAQTQKNHCLSTCPSDREYHWGRRNGKNSWHFSQGWGLRCPQAQLVLPGGNCQSIIIIIIIISQFAQEQPAIRGAIKALCKASPEAHLEENWIHFPTPAQPNRSFNSTFSLEWCLFSRGLSSFLSLSSPSAFLGRHWCVQESQSIPGRAANLNTQMCIKAVIKLITDITDNTCSHLPKTSYN